VEGLEGAEDVLAGLVHAVQALDHAGQGLGRLVLPRLLELGRADMPATSAQFCRASPPSFTDMAIRARTWLIAVPPASASIPTDASALAKPRTLTLGEPDDLAWLLRCAAPSG
jgi:hypothetical protein